MAFYWRKRKDWTPTRLWRQARADDTAGVYVLKSAKLTKLYNAYYPDSDKIIVKIGYSKDIRDRVLNLNGMRAPRQLISRYQHHEPYAGFSDWTLWRINRCADLSILYDFEKECGAGCERVSMEKLRLLRTPLKDAKPLNIAIEIFIADQKLIEDRFEEIVR